MLRVLAALALLTVACAGETQYVEAPGQDDEAIRAATAEAWGAVGVEVPEAYTLLFLDEVTLEDACEYGRLPPGSVLGGCAPASDVVLLNAEQAPEQQLENLIHEMGHLLRGGRRGHLRCGEDADRGTAFGSDVMCLTGRGPGGMPTERDAAFVQ
jgi:hypothetical protein